MDMTGRTPQIIGIAGGSCAGKSWLAERLVESLQEKALRVSLDSFYLDQSHLSMEERARVNFDHPSAIDWPKFEKALRDCAGREVFSVPRYNFATHARENDDWAMEPAPVVIVEGLWLFRRPKIRELFALKIFIRSSEELCVARRLARDTQERGRSADQVRMQLERHTLPMFSRYVAPQEKWADVILEAPVSARDVSGILNKIAGKIHAVGI
jgi:uridine kinase